mgnify:FL=1
MLILGESLIEMKDQLQGKVVIIHQPAEEMPLGGAQGMIKDGVLEGVDYVLGCTCDEYYGSRKSFLPSRICSNRTCLF